MLELRHVILGQKNSLRPWTQFSMPKLLHKYIIDNWWKFSSLKIGNIVRPSPFNHKEHFWMLARNWWIEICLLLRLRFSLFKSLFYLIWQVFLVKLFQKNLMKSWFFQSMSRAYFLAQIFYILGIWLHLFKLLPGIYLNVSKNSGSKP